MTRRTYVYDADMDVMIQVAGPGSNYFEEEPTRGPQIIRDIDAYRAAASDVACEGKRPVISGRRQHREFLKRNGYVEVGNEVPVSGQREVLTRAERINDIRRAMGDFGPNTRD